jgi:hypothetical protein
VTVPRVVGCQVMVYSAPAGTTSLRPGLAIGLQPSVHCVVCCVTLHVSSCSSVSNMAPQVTYWGSVGTGEGSGGREKNDLVHLGGRI